jgi:hypothetical protein
METTASSVRNRRNKQGFDYGYGDGDGDGYGDGFAGFAGGLGFGGIVIGRAGEFDVVHLAPWPYVRVGCELHSISYWRANWTEIAQRNGVEVDCDFDAILDRAEGGRHGD